jgi:poly-gamma-glutamate capsule biosynthesis protein CapA/YwtB (metallophosphatase superfamily)
VSQACLRNLAVRVCVTHIVEVRARAAVGVVVAGATLVAALGVPHPAARPAPTPALALASDTVRAQPVAAPVPAPRRERRSATVVMGGDLLWHNTVWQSAAEDGHGRYDFDPMFAGVRSLVAGADLALCHEEVPFAAAGQPLQNFPVFAAPPEAAAWIGSFGFDGCTTASNHSIDQGYEGLVRTADLLERAGVAHIGTFRTRAERRQPVILTTASGVRVGVVAGTYGTNGFPLPAGREWSVSLWGAPNLLAQAHAARRAGAEIVVVHLHGGDEYSHDANAAQVALAERLTRSPDVDLVLGDHAHVVQPITKLHGKWVVYGMGNLVAQQDPARADTYNGILVRFTFTERRDGRFAVTRAAYAPIGWNLWRPGSAPIRVVRLHGAAAHVVTSYVLGLGPQPGLQRL